MTITVTDGSSSTTLQEMATAVAATEFLVPVLRDVQHLSVLNAVLTKTLRTHPVVSAMLSREAPSSSMSASSNSGKAIHGSSSSSGALDGVPVAGVWVLADTRVSVPEFSLQRTAEVFLAPDKWRPER